MFFLLALVITTICFIVNLITSPSCWSAWALEAFVVYGANIFLFVLVTVATSAKQTPYNVTGFSNPGGFYSSTGTITTYDTHAPVPSGIANVFVCAFFYYVIVRVTIGLCCWNNAEVNAWWWWVASGISAVWHFIVDPMTKHYASVGGTTMSLLLSGLRTM